MIDVEKLYATTDARVWARAYLEVVNEKHWLATDEGFLIGWFANAIETGRNHPHT